MAVKIKTIANGTKGAKAASLGPMELTSFYLSSSSEGLSAEGTVSSDVSLVTCAIVRAFRDAKPNGTAWMQLMLATPDAYGQWTAPLGILAPGRYLFTCCGQGQDFDSAEIIVEDAQIVPYLLVNPPVASPFAININGTVNTAGNLVTCTLTPIDAMGNLRPGEKACTKVVTASQAGNWMVGYVPSDVGEMRFSNDYKFEASAPGEGTSTQKITV
jgi:hypothetical protein